MGTESNVMVQGWIYNSQQIQYTYDLQTSSMVTKHNVCTIQSLEAYVEGSFYYSTLCYIVTSCLLLYYYN